ncbi:maleylacetoacetate isomerase [Burkholderia glumae]|uniref:Maleylacetoacetate isomerase n=2 Tax=Burkholderia glumae TaxID=337 RepID=A0AAP9XWF2_BURGL|nr:maleylacetoacetate isomerase [Burkholderia glumae]ACR32186.1 Maleylacetoacetate isomerase [Burkholderia glumae BGR1]AJY63849.1 maleylacetoacetate isomerase [Burkholderia glumae LMG 2196 = ATCC 33617]KHJ63043.1 maleylacetoacetate isomerase [Burkholderia glumae]MCM2484630.1 maleylacetoacetate isomerase [Burkholderia glumae]MCM2495011.1 maleylacetoacetate isomerase [Burkholderia glumae]
MTEATLYGYFRSSASYRVRIALNLKGIDYRQIPVHLLRGGGEQLGEAYRQIQPDGVVPAFVDGDGPPLAQSLAIVEYLDECFPQPPLLPSAPADRAYVRAVALQIACEIHPLNNLRVLSYLKATLGVSDAQKSAWYAHWIGLGFASLERRLAAEPRVGRCVFGDTPGLADLCLVPQVWNAKRFAVPLDAYPTLMRLYGHAAALPAFARAEPSLQPDAEPPPA